MKLLGLDYGMTRIGYAVGETALGIAFGRDVIENKSEDFVIQELKKIIREENIEKIVLGLPKFLDGNVSEQTNLTKEIGRKIKEECQLEVVYFDERLSTVEATKKLRMQNYKEKEQKGKKDVLAAEIILQRYLDLL